MSWSALPTDYTDAVWSGLRRYIPIDNEDGTVSFQDVTIYDNKEKSFFGASDANDMNKAMNDIMSLLGEATQADAFPNIVSPGGEMTGALTMNNNVSVNSKLSDGTVANLIGRNSSNNIWIGTADDGAMQKQGDIFLATSADGNAYVSRNDVRSQILDRGVAGKVLASGLSLTPGNSVNVPGSSEYSLFLVKASGVTTPWLLWRNSTRVTGNGAYSTESNMWISAMSFTTSGDTMTFANYSQMAFSMTNGSAGSITDTTTVTTIIGVL